MTFLLIDTCTERGVIAYGDRAHCLFKKELPFGPSQSKFLLPYLAEALRPFGSPPPLEAIGVGMGPGSYTGIRLGVAAAQALAYAWKVPLVGLSALDGFVPVESSSASFAAVLDARIGGLYMQKGRCDASGMLDQGDPHVYPLEEAEKHLQEVTHLVTPFARVIQAKLNLQYPDNQWIWEERAPCVDVLLQKAEHQYRQGQFITPPAHLDLLYLRQTEAEKTRSLLL